MAPLLPFPGQVPWSDINPWKGKPSQAFLQYLSSLDTPVRLIVSQGGTPRTVLSQPTTFYVATNGNDANNGLTPATAWATLAHAMAVLTGQIDFGGQQVTLQAVAGHANFTSKLSVTPWVGGGHLIFDGGGGSIAVTNDRAIDIGGDAAFPALGNGGALPGSLAIQNVALSATRGADVNAGRAINVVVPAFVLIKSGVSFGACGGHQIFAGQGAFIEILADYSITGGGASHWVGILGGFIFFQFAQTITIANNPTAFGTFAVAGTGGTLSVAGLTFANAAFVTGQRFSVNTAGSINTNNSGLTYLPGTTAGSQTSPGTYN